MQGLSKKNILFLVTSVIGFASIFAALGYLEFLIGIPFAIAFFYFITLSTKNWLYFFIYSIPIWNNLSAEGINAIDVAVLLIWFSGLIIWFINKLAFRKERVIHNIADWMILFFFFMYLFYLVMGVTAGESKLTASISEYLRAAVILFYFPIRNEFNTKKKFLNMIKHLFIALFFSYVAWAILNYIRIINAKNVYQLTRFERTNQEIFSGGVIFGAIFYLNLKKFKDKSFFLLFTLFSGIALIVTFSRVYWLTTAIGLFVGFLIFDLKRKINILLVVGVLLTIFIVSIQIISPEFADFVLETFEERATSIGEFGKDKSFLSRFDEIAKLTHQWGQFYFGGTGLAQEYSYYNSSFALYNWVSPFVHNAYVHLTFKAGFPMALVYFFVLIYYNILGFGQIKKSNSVLQNSLLMSASICITIFLIVNLITSTYASRPGAIYLALIIAFINIAINLKHDK